ATRSRVERHRRELPNLQHECHQTSRYTNPARNLPVEHAALTKTRLTVKRHEPHEQDHGVNRPPVTRGRGDVIGPPEQAVITRAKVEVTEDQRRLQQGVHRDEQATTAPDRANVGAQFELLLLGSAARTVRVLDRVSHDFALLSLLNWITGNC